MVPVEGTEEILPADLVLIAAGFLGSQKYVTDAFKVEVNQRTNVYGRSVRDARQQRQSMNP